MPRDLLLEPVVRTERAGAVSALAASRWAPLVAVAGQRQVLLYHDETLDIVRRYPQAVVVTHPFSDFASQCNFGLTQVTGPWVLSLDADYELSEALVQELVSLAPPDDVAGYRARFVYRIHGHALRGSLYPPRTVLYRREQASYRNEGHGHRVTVTGGVRDLAGTIYHDDRKPLSRWFASQQRYASREAEHLLSTPRQTLTWSGAIRRTGWLAPVPVCLYVLLVKGCAFDSEGLLP